MEENKIIEWTPSAMLEVTLNEPDDFLKVRGVQKYLHLHASILSKSENEIVTPPADKIAS